MNARTLKAACLVAVLAIGSAACQSDAPTEPQAVRLAMIDGAAHGGAPMTTAMTQEVTHTPAYAGDPSGSGTARLTINVGQGEVCWDNTVQNLTSPATASHIHKAPAGVRGGIVVFLSPPDASGSARGCATGVDRDLLKDILQNSADYYVNVHTTDFPASAIRGQLD